MYASVYLHMLFIGDGPVNVAHIANHDCGKVFVRPKVYYNSELWGPILARHTIATISSTHLCISDEDAILLFSALEKMESLRSVIFLIPHFSVGCLAEFARRMPPRLEEFTLRDARVPGPGGYEVLINAFPPTLTELSLSGIVISHHVTRALAAKGLPLTTLCLPAMDLAAFEAISFPPTLTKLELNGIDAVTLVMIADCLHRLPNLIVLDISGHSAADLTPLLEVVCKHPAICSLKIGSPSLDPAAARRFAKGIVASGHYTLVDLGVDATRDLLKILYSSRSNMLIALNSARTRVGRHAAIRRLPVDLVRLVSQMI